MDTWSQTALLIAGSRRRRTCGAVSGKPRSLPIAEWPKSDRLGWEDACRPGQRLKRGGAASHLARVSQADIANRYGLYLDFLQRNGRLDPAMEATTLVNHDNVSQFIAELKARVRSVTVWNSVYKLRRAAQLIAPGGDFGWLAEIEKEIALVMVPRSKTDRVVLTERLVEAGLALIKEAEMFGKMLLTRAVGIRDGLLIALLALHPLRIKTSPRSRSSTLSSKSMVGGGSMFQLMIPSLISSTSVRYRNSSPMQSTNTSTHTLRFSIVAMPNCTRSGSHRLPAGK